MVKKRNWNYSKWLTVRLHFVSSHWATALHSKTGSIVEFLMFCAVCCDLFAFTNSVQTRRICLGDGVLHTRWFMMTIFLSEVGVLFRSGKYQTATLHLTETTEHVSLHKLISSERIHSSLHNYGWKVFILLSVWWLLTLPKGLELFWFLAFSRGETRRSKNRENKT